MKNNKHQLKITITIFTIFFLFIGTAYGITKYYGVKKALDSSYHSSGINKQRNVSAQIKQKKPISILLMGADTKTLGQKYRGRIDSMMVLTLNPKTNKTTVTSIPRNIAVKIPGYGTDKISAAYTHGQAKTTIATVQKMLNVPIDFYALINMGGTEKVIDQAGGIELRPTLSFKYDGYHFHKDELMKLNGKKALAYSRMYRDDPQGDYGRQTRERAVMTSLVHKSSSASILLNQCFIEALYSETQTDMTFNDLTSIVKDYRSARKRIEQTFLQGFSQSVKGQDMEVVDKIELQRVTDYIRGNLGLKKVTTGDIEYKQ